MWKWRRWAESWSFLLGQALSRFCELEADVNIPVIPVIYAIRKVMIQDRQVVKEPTGFSRLLFACVQQFLLMSQL